MKVLQLNTVVGTGSVGRITASLYERSIANHMEAYVAYGRGTAPEGIHALKIGTPFDMYAHVLRNFFLGESGFGSAQKTEAFLREVDKLQPDLIHLHNIHGFYLQIEMLFSYIKEKHIPVVWTFHDCWPMTGHCAYFDYAGCDKWRTGCNHCEQHRSAYPYALFKDNSIQAYKRKQKAFTGVENLTIVTPSQWLADLVKQSFLKEYPVVVIPNGVDRTVFKVPEHVETTTSTQLLGVANIWEKRKGFPHFLQLARLLPDRYHITMVGLSQKQMREIEKDSTLQDKITGMTRTENQQELARLYGEAALYINTTMEDNFPTTNLEALACGTPVITFATGGSPEAILGNPELGAVIPQGDVEALAQKIIEYTNRPKAGAKIAEYAQQYDSKICFRRYIELYRTCVGEKGKNES